MRGSSQQQVPGGRVAGSLGTGSLCSQELWGSWNGRKRDQGWCQTPSTPQNRELFAAPNQPRGHAWATPPTAAHASKDGCFTPEVPFCLNNSALY